MITRSRFVCGVLALTAFLGGASPGSAQLTGLENGEWHYLGGDAGHTRSAPQLTQINASNFSDLEVAWTWRGDNFGPSPEYTVRSTPVFVDGVLYTVVGQRRQVVAIDAASGETLWVFREPATMRYLRSPRTDFGKGVAYAEVDGRGVIYITSPAYFLWALDAKTGRPLESWGAPVPIESFSRTGVVDLIPDLVGDWGPWQEFMADRGIYDPDHGIPRQLGMVTSSSPPIVVNGVVVVLVGHEPSYDQTRIENVPGDIMGYDARTGRHLWKFHVIPRPGEFGHETWENDAWQWSGDLSSWAPASADPELGLVYIVTNASTVQSYAGHRPGHNLFGGSVIALDVQTGERRWHFQIHHSDQWNYDIPTAPILMDLTVDGVEIPALIQNTKQGLVFAFNRETGEPIWPIEERPVMQTQVPGNYTSPTQPYPTRPEPLDRIVTDGITDEFVIDYTPGSECAGADYPESVPGRGPLRAAASLPPRQRLPQCRRLQGRIEHLPSTHRGSLHGNDVRVAQPGLQRPRVHGAHERGGRGAGVARTESGELEGAGATYAHHRYHGGKVCAGRPSRVTAAHRWPAALQASVPGSRRLRHEHGRKALGHSDRRGLPSGSGTTRF